MLEEILEYASVRTLVVAAISIYVLLRFQRRVATERKIRNLGGHAKKIPLYMPWGVDLAYKAVRGAMQNRNVETWSYFFSSRRSDIYTVEAEVVGRRTIFTADPENIKAILATQFQDYGKGELFHREWKAFLGDSIFTTDLEQWHDSRALLRPQFIKDRVSDLEVFETHVQLLIQKIVQGGKRYDGTQGGEVEVSDLLFRYTLDAATHFLLGRSVDSLNTPEQEFAEAFGEVQRVQSIITRAGPLAKLVPRKTFNKGIKTINEFVTPFIDEALQLSPEELATKTKSEEGYTFLHALAGFTRDRTVLRDQLVAVLLAGRDTTASGLSWTFYELSRRPEIVQKLRAEIIEVVGLENPPTYEHLKNMKYLQAVMNETLRLYPLVPFNVRLALKDTTLPRGGGPDGLSPIGVLKDTNVGYSTLIMHRRPDLNPPMEIPSLSPSSPSPNSEKSSPQHTVSVLDFCPERWATWHPKSWSFIPFNGGPRICIGQQFALTEMGYTLVRMLQRFERLESFMGKLDGGNPVLKCDIVLQPGQGVRVGFFEGEKS